MAKLLYVVTLLCVSTSVHGGSSYFASLLDHPENPYNKVNSLLSTLFPAERTTYPQWLAASDQPECPKVQTLRARLELHWLFNDPNLDGYMTNDDVLWDIINYNAPAGDMCSISEQEALDHVGCVYSYPRDFGQHYARTLLDNNKDGRVTWQEWQGVVPFNVSKVDFLRQDYNFFKSWCESNNYQGTDCNLLRTEPVPEFMM